MMKRVNVTVVGLVALAVACLVFVAAAAPSPPTPISGTFFKGPAVGGRDRLAGQNVLQVRDEKGFGTLEGGVLTGSAEYTIDEEMVNFAAGGIGTFRAHIVITTADGSLVTLGLTGFTSAVNTATGTVVVNGNWAVISAVGPLAGLHGEGQYTGVENFPTGETSGAFSGLIH